jgi:hypothetical protein
MHTVHSEFILLVLKGDQGDVLPTFIPYRGVGLPV